MGYQTVCILRLHLSLSLSLFLRVCLVGGVEKWENRKWGKDRKWKDGKNLIFSHMCLVGMMEKWRHGKLICLFEKKNEMIENVIQINLLPTI